MTSIYSLPKAAWSGDAREAAEAVEREIAKFDTIQGLARNSFATFDAAGNVVWIHKPGDLDFSSLKSKGISKEDLMRHYIFMLEYCWNVLDCTTKRPKHNATGTNVPARHHPQGTGELTTIIDASGLSFSKLSRPETLSFLRSFSQLTSCNYPSRSQRFLLVDPPFWLERSFGLVLGTALDEETRKMVQVLGGGGRETGERRREVEAELGIDVRGLLDKCDGQSVLDTAMRDYAIKLCKTNTSVCEKYN